MFTSRSIPAAQSSRHPGLRVYGALLFGLMLSAGVLFASGSSRGGVSSGPTGPTMTDPFLITHVVKATITAVDPSGAKFTVRDLVTEQLHEIKVHGDLTLRAKNKKQFGGRRKLQLADLAVGQIVKLTVRDADGAILKLRVEGSVET